MTDGRGGLETAPRRDKLVIGGSAGAIRAVQQLLQDPDDAEYPDMPSSALRYVSADHVGSIPDPAARLSGLTGASAPPPVGAPEDLRAEMRASFDGSQISLAESRRRLHGSACPDCAGPLSVLGRSERASESVERAAESREHADRIRRMLTDRS